MSLKFYRNITNNSSEEEKIAFVKEFNVFRETYRNEKANLEKGQSEKVTLRDFGELNAITPLIFVIILKIIVFRV